jgi:hypothetical protein
MGMVVVEYDDPRTMDPPIPDWAYTRCHVDTSGGFTPSDANNLATGRQTRFEIGGLVPGDTYYVKLVIIDEQGNVATTSSQQTLATQKVGAWHENSDTLRVNLVPNGSFGQATLPIASNPPDGWSMQNGTWGTEAEETTSIQATGGRSIDFSNGGGGDGRLYSDFFPVSENEMYAFHWYLQVDVAHNDNRAEIGFYTYDKDLGNETKVLLGQVTPTTAWIRYGSSYIPSPEDGGVAVRYVRVYVERKDVGAPATSYHLYCDRIHCFLQKHKFSGFRSAAGTITSGSPQQIPFDQQVFDIVGQSISGTVYGLDTSTNPGRFTCLQPGEYAFKAAVGVASASDGTELEISLYKNGAVEHKGELRQAAANGNQRLVVATTIDLVKDDYVDVYFEHDEGSALSMLVGSDETYFMGARTPGDE